MPTVLSADFHGNPLPLATWQADFEREVVYFNQFYRCRLRFLTPELREELVQEALVQTAQVFCNQYRTHGGRTEHRHNIARYITQRVKMGRSCTRPNGHNADPLDHTFRTTGPQREDEYRREAALEHAPGGRELSSAFRLDLLEWIGSQPDRLRQYARLAVHGTPDAEIRRTMGVSASAVARYRGRLRQNWETYLAG